MAQLEGIERQWEAKKHSLAEELERVEKLLANAYDRYVCMCEQLMHHMYWSNGRVSHHTRHILVNTSYAGRWGLASPAMLGGGDCLTSYAGRWGLASPAMLGGGDCLTSYAGRWGLASPAMLGGGDCLTSYAGGWGLPHQLCWGVGTAIRCTNTNKQSLELYIHAMRVTAP